VEGGLGGVTIGKQEVLWTLISAKNTGLEEETDIKKGKWDVKLVK